MPDTTESIDGLPPGPYTYTHTTTYDIAPVGSFKVTITRDVKSSHQPMGCGCHDHEDEEMGELEKERGARLVVDAKLDEILEVVKMAVPQIMELLKNAFGGGTPH